MLRNIISISFISCIKSIKLVGRYISEKCDFAYTSWKQLPIFHRNIIVGIVIALLLHVMQNSNSVSSLENWAMDLMMKLKIGTPEMAVGATENEPLRFTFIDIDEDTYREWGEPLITPRDKLLQLIQFAAKNYKNYNSAKVIVVDIELSRKSDHDKDLINFLENYNGNHPPLLVVRDFYPKSKDTEQKDFYFRPSILDSKLVETNINWVHSTFQFSDYDQVVRYWNLLAMGCLHDSPVIVPSFQLLIDAYLRAPNELPGVIAQLKMLLPKECNGIEQARKVLRGELYYAKRIIKFDQESRSRTGERIIYSLPWTENSELRTVSARRVLKEEEKFHHLTDDAIIVIGSSFKESGDLVQTPVGEMPGALVIINAIKSLHQFGQISPPPLLIKILVELGLIVAMSWAFARFDSFRGAAISVVVILFFLLPISFWLFKYGVWIDFAIPLLGIQFHQLIARYEENATYRKFYLNASSTSYKEEK